MLVALCWLLSGGHTVRQVRAQSTNPLSNEELVRLINQLPSRPELRDEIVSEIRRRGINFPMTNGLRSLVATKSRNDALLRRTLEEAERRRKNPSSSRLPSKSEERDVLARARAAALAAAEAMPDFIVKQQITRSYAFGATKNWSVSDRLTIAVSYRAGSGERYKLLAVNGLPAGADNEENKNYEEVKGTTSTGEYVSMLAMLFSDESKAHFEAVDTDLLRNRRTIVYEYEVKKRNSKHTIKNGYRIIGTGYRGRLWIDRENYRVLRVEDIATDIPADFPVTAASSRIDYDWVTIAERHYLLPSRAELELTNVQGSQMIQNRNEIRFRDYQKYGSEVKIIEEDIFEEEPPQKKP